MKDYYDRRAPEYDDWHLGAGLFIDRQRPGWNQELRAIERVLSGLPPGRVLDVACGTGYLTRRLRGDVFGLDQSEAMLDIARERMPAGRFAQGDALAPLFPDASFDRVFTGHFYGHLRPSQRASLLAEARRVAAESVIVDSALRSDVETEEVQERILSDGSRHDVYKRYFVPEGLAEELGGGRILFAGTWFVAVTSNQT